MFEMSEPVTKEVISEWFDTGVQQGATHMLVISDSFSYEYYPMYVQKGEDPRKIEQEYIERPMTGVMEVYDLSLPKDPQLDEERARHY
jgi:hypothetical protein